MAHAWEGVVIGLAVIAGVVYLIARRRLKFKGFGLSIGDPTGVLDPKALKDAQKKRKK